MDVTVQVDTTQKIVDTLGRVPAAARAGVLDALNSLRDLVRGRTPYKSGHLKGSWSNVEFLDGGLSYSGEFGTGVDYAEILEHGLYPRVGQRTIESGGRIYSRQAPGGMIEPILENPALVDAAIDLVLNQIIRGLESAGA
jgi:hypothetical protein